MANLKANNVFVDTQVFEASNFNFNSTALSERVRLAQANVVNVFLTTITVGEVDAHIVEKINLASSKLKKFRNEEGRILQNVTGYGLVLGKVDKQKCIDEVRAEFRKFLADTRVTVLDTRSVDVEKIFGEYFGLKPPFGEGRKKEEFPDAFAQHALSNWCNKNHCDMYVISANHDWHAPKDHLIPLVRLEEFLDAAVIQVSDCALSEHAVLETSRVGFDPDFVVDCLSQALFAAKIFFSSLHRNVTQKELNLLQFTASTVTQPST